MSEVQITTGPTEVLAAGTVFLCGETRPFAFSYGGQTAQVLPLLEVPAKGPNGNFWVPLPEGALLPGGDAMHKVGGATVYAQLRRLARHPSYIGKDEFLFSYEVTRPVAVPQLRSVA